MTELTPQQVAQKVRDYLTDARPAGIALEVVESDIRRVEGWWRVPVRPDRWPEPIFPYYEALADIEATIQENEHLNILITTGEPIRLAA